MTTFFVELRRMGAAKLAHVASKLDHRALHTEANAKERHALLAGVADSRNLAFAAALAKSAGDEDAIVAGEHALGPFVFELFALNARDAHLRRVRHAGVIERLIN